MVMQKFWGVIEVYYGIVQVVNCLYFLLGLTMVPRESGNNAYAKFWWDKQRVSFSIFEFPIIHFVCPSNFALTIVFKCSWGHCIFPRAFENNGLCKIWGADKVYYGEFENREWYF